MKESFIITGITCQSCVNRIEKKLSKLDFINELNFINSRIYIKRNKINGEK